MIDLVINERDALATWGVRMGEGFIDIIDNFPSVKAFVENESRLENGKRIIAADMKVEARQINLPFTIEGLTEDDYRIKKKTFLAELMKGVTVLSVPPLGGEKYKLVYLGKGATYDLCKDRTFSKVVLKFEEPNPADRK